MRKRCLEKIILGDRFWRPLDAYAIVFDYYIPPSFHRSIKSAENVFQKEVFLRLVFFFFVHFSSRQQMSLVLTWSFRMDSL